MRHTRKDSADVESVRIDVDDLRRRFCAMRSARRLSQADVATLLGVSQATISSFEHGRHMLIRPGTLLALRAFVSDCVREEPAEFSSPAVRVVIRRAAEAHCVWCGGELPKLRRPIRYCPYCGGHQSAVCTCGARAFDPAARYCSACGGALEAEAD